MKKYIKIFFVLFLLVVFATNCYAMTRHETQFIDKDTPIPLSESSNRILLVSAINRIINLLFIVVFPITILVLCFKHKKKSIIRLIICELLAIINELFFLFFIASDTLTDYTIEDSLHLRAIYMGIDILIFLTLFIGRKDKSKN